MHHFLHLHLLIPDHFVDDGNLFHLIPDDDSVNCDVDIFRHHVRHVDKAVQILDNRLLGELAGDMMRLVCPNLFLDLFYLLWSPDPRHRHFLDDVLDPWNLDPLLHHLNERLGVRHVDGHPPRGECFDHPLHVLHLGHLNVLGLTDDVGHLHFLLLEHLHLARGLRQRSLLDHLVCQRNVLHNHILHVLDGRDHDRDLLLYHIGQLHFERHFDNVFDYLRHLPDQDNFLVDVNFLRHHSFHLHYPLHCRLDWLLHHPFDLLWDADEPRDVVDDLESPWDHAFYLLDHGHIDVHVHFDLLDRVHVHHWALHLLNLLDSVHGSIVIVDVAELVHDDFLLLLNHLLHLLYNRHQHDLVHLLLQLRLSPDADQPHAGCVLLKQDTIRLARRRHL
mmetsp:Transcript_92516/g.283254  ORF Transcript_92516/g.283254 Transcript_92516/m.283254 type:complete len:390 (+) Transcript_92516:570-1739(+)